MPSIKLYQGRISQIDEMRSSRNGGIFKRVYFQIKDMEKSTPENKVYFWAKTDLVPSYRNYSRWEKNLYKGNVLKNLQLKTSDTVDADSFPVLMGNLPNEPERMPALQKELWKN